MFNHNSKIQVLPKNVIFLLLLTTLTSFIGFGQEQTKVIQGRARSLNNELSNVLIVNLNSKKSTITDSLGLFTIEVQLKDSLRITAVQYLTRDIIITKEIFDENSVVVNLVENVIDLDEVTVTPYNLTGKIDLDLKRLPIAPLVTTATLHLPNADIDKMTQSERLLIEADRGKYFYYYGTAIVINTHKIMNKVSGRTKSFENRVARDKKLGLEKEIIAKFSKKAISENFDIPETSIDGFLSFCLAQTDFSEVSNAGNTMEIWKYLKARSIEFKNTHVLKQ